MKTIKKLFLISLAVLATSCSDSESIVFDQTQAVEQKNGLPTLELGQEDKLLSSKDDGFEKPELDGDYLDIKPILEEKGIDHWSAAYSYNEETRYSSQLSVATMMVLKTYGNKTTSLDGYIPYPFGENTTDQSKYAFTLSKIDSLVSDVSLGFTPEEDITAVANWVDSSVDGLNAWVFDGEADKEAINDYALPLLKDGHSLIVLNSFGAVFVVDGYVNTRIRKATGDTPWAHLFDKYQEFYHVNNCLGGELDGYYSINNNFVESLGVVKLMVIN